MTDLSALPPASARGAPRLRLVLAAVVAALLVDLVVETVWSGSSLGVTIPVLAGACLAAGILAWRRWSAAAGSLVMLAALLGLILVAELRAVHGDAAALAMLGMPLSRIVPVVLLAAIVCAAALLARTAIGATDWSTIAAGSRLRQIALAAVAAVTLYCAALLIAGPFRALPFWMQGTFVAVQFFVPVAFAVALALLGIALVRGRSTGLFLPAAALLFAAAFALGSVELARSNTPHLGARLIDRWIPPPASPSPVPGPLTQSGGTSAVAAPNVAADDWMQPYRSLTLDHAFEAVARRIRFEPYSGVQRGARGTARAQAGNAIDQALLLAAVLRGAGYEVRFVHGSLSPQNTQALLRGLYPPRMPSVVSAADYAPYEPTGDEQLAAVVRDHYWLEVNQGATWLPLDPSFPRATIGEAYGTASDRFTEPADMLHQRVEFTWKVDTAARAAQQVARWNGTVADLGLQPISLVVDAVPGTPKQPPPPKPSSGGAFGGALSGTPEPQKTNEPSASGQAPTALRYVRSIETDTRRPATGNVSLANQPGSFVRREWVEIKLTGPGGLARTIERTLYEREADAPSMQAEHRRYTILLVPGPVSPSYADDAVARAREALKLDEWRGELTRLESQANSADGAKKAVERAAWIETAIGKTAGYLMALDFAARSDALTDRIAYPNQIAVVRPIPRILIASSETQGDRSPQVISALSLDLRLDEVQAYAYPGFPSALPRLFLTARGMQESVLEAQLVARWTGREAVSTAALMTEAGRQRVPLLTITGTDSSALAGARGLTPRARSEIEAALAAGHHVIAPDRPVAIGGRSRSGWWDVDPASGAVVGVMEGGQHQGMAEYSMSSEKIALNDNNAFFLGCLVGSNTTMFLVCGKLLETGEITPELIAAVEAYVQAGACNSMCPPEAGASASVSASAGDCFTLDKIGGMKPSVGASASVDFCAKYNQGFKCAGGLILAGLKGERPGVSVSAEAKITLPNCRDIK